MRTIHKYLLSITDEQVVEMPIGAEILTVQTQGANSVCLWAEVDAEQPKESVTIFTYGTGHQMRDVKQRYIGTYQLNGGGLVGNGLVFHVYREVEG